MKYREHSLVLCNNEIRWKKEIKKNENYTPITYS